jgi:hypothetical protein
MPINDDDVEDLRTPNHLTKVETQPIQSETAGDKVLPPKCEVMMSNRMRCTRVASKIKTVNPDIGTKICEVCWELAGAPRTYEDIEK